MERTFQIVVFGATGFAGRLVAEYLQDTHGDTLRWAIAGRSRQKLEALQADLAARRPGLAPVAIEVADSHDDAALAALVAKTRVICTTVGPYARHGGPLVAAAVASGTHVCDLTGEPQFIRRMIDAHHERAASEGTRIVHCCGFDSIPSDLGTLLVQETTLARDERPCDRVEMVVRWLSGGFSGGTIASMANLLEEASDPAVRRVLGDPYSLCSERGPDGREQRGPRYSEAAGVWTAPFVMAAVNERVVRRSNDLLGHRYGRDFRYGESMQTGRGLRGRLAANATTGVLGAFTVGMSMGRVRKRLLRLFPEPGQGPSPEQIEKGGFGIRLFGWRDGEVVTAVDVVGERDPGYGATACMLAESAIHLAGDPAQLGVAGVCTPASALGRPLIDRLNERLVRFTVREEV